MRILVVRPDAIGDVVLMLPLLNTIKKAYPDAEIYTLQQPYTIPLLQGHPAITAAIPDWRKMRRVRGLPGFFAYAKYLRSFGFDMAFLPYLEPYYAMLTIAAKIPIRVGDSNKILMRPWLTHSVPLNFRNVLLHEAEQSAKLIWALRPEIIPDMTMNLVVSEADHALASDLLRESGVEGNYIIVHPRSGGGNRPWLPGKYAETIDLLAEKLGVQVVLTGAGAKEIEVISEIRNRSQNPIIDLSGKTPLPVLMGLIQKASVVIGTDTGPTHIAAAMGVPVVSVSPTKFVKALRWGPWQTANRVVSRSQDCKITCTPYRCKKTYCLDAIGSRTVADAIVEMSRTLDAIDRIPSKHQWIKTSMHTMVYWSGRESHLDTVIAQYCALRRNGFVVMVAVRSWRFRRILAVALGVEVEKISVIPPFDWVRMVGILMSRDITVVFVVGPVVAWYWFVVRQICALRQYCPPVAIGITAADETSDAVILRITHAVYT